MTRIHVSQRNIRDNGRDGGSRPVVVVRRMGTTEHCNGVVIRDRDGLEVARVVYRRDTAGAAKVWIETAADVEVV